MTRARQNLITEVVRYWTKLQDTSSRFFEQDRAEFIARLRTKKNSELEQQLWNLSSMADPNSRFNRSVEREIERLDRAGMFNPSTMRPENSLD